MLEHHLNQTIAIATKDKHARYDYLNSHYVGKLEQVTEHVAILSEWNDKFVLPSDGDYYYVGIETEPSDRKPVSIPITNIKHVYELDKEQLVKKAPGSKYSTVLILGDNMR